MKWRIFENKIQQEVSAQKIDLDVDALWGALEPAVDEINAGNNKRRGIIWWFFGGLFLTAIGMGYFYFNNGASEENLTVQKENIAVQESPEIQMPTEKSVKQDLATLENSNDSNISNSDSPLENSNKNFTNNISEKTDNQRTNHSKNSTNQKAASSLANNSNEKRHSFSSNKNSVENEKNESFDSSNLIEKTASIISENENLAIENNLNENENDENSKKENSDYKQTEIIESITQNEDEPNEELSLTEPEKVPETPVINKTEKVEESETIGKTPLKEQEENRRRKFQFAIALQGGVAFTDRTLDAKSTDFETLRQNRDRAESSLETVQIGLLFSLKHKELGLSLTAGLNYAQINERMNFSDVTIQQDSIFGIQAFVEQIDGSVDTIFGEVPHEIIFRHNKEYFNKYKMLEIPVLIGYEKELNDKFSLGLQAGVFMNLSLKTEGQIWEGENNFTDLEDSTIYHSKVDLSYHFGATATYHLNENIGIYCSPFFRVFPKNFAEESYGLSQKYQLFGGNLGVKFSF